MTKIKIDREIFFSKISKIVGFTPSKTVLPAFDNFKLTISNGNMEIIAADANMQCKMNCPVSASEDFAVCVPAKLLVKTLGLFRENEVILTVKSENKIELKSGKAKYNITIDCFPKDFPRMEAGNLDSEINISQFMLKASLKSAQKFVNDKGPQTNMSGINIAEVDKKIVFTGADNKTMFRAAISPISIGHWDPILIPIETASHVMGLLDDKGEISVVHSSDRIRFFTPIESPDYFEVTSTTSTNKFPNSEKLFGMMPQGFYTINTAELLDAVKRLKLYSGESEFAAITFGVISDTELELMSQDLNFGRSGQEGISFKNNGAPEIKKSISADFLIKILAIVDTSEVNLYFEEANNKPLFIIPNTSSDEENIYSFLLVSQVA